MNILGKVTRLRAVEEEDLKKLHEWANDPEIWDMVGGWHFPYSMESQKQWFLSLDKDSTRRIFAVETMDGKLIGTASFESIDWKNNHLYFGLMIGDKEARGAGYALDVVMAMERYAFEELHIERAEGSAIEYNTRSLRFFVEKCGCKEEGRLRKWYFRKGRYWDKILVGITRDDYLAFKSQSKYWD